MLSSKDSFSITISAFLVSLKNYIFIDLLHLIYGIKILYYKSFPYLRDQFLGFHYFTETTINREFKNNLL